MPPTLCSVRALVQKLATLCSQLPHQVVPEALPDDNIYHVMTRVALEDPCSTFNRRFDILYAEHLRDQNGRLPNIQRGQYGLDAVVLYLQTAPWSQMPLDIVEPKLLQLFNKVVYIALTYVQDLKSKQKSGFEPEHPFAIDDSTPGEPDTSVDLHPGTLSDTNYIAHDLNYQRHGTRLGVSIIKDLGAGNALLNLFDAGMSYYFVLGLEVLYDGLRWFRRLNDSDRGTRAKILFETVYKEYKDTANEEDQASTQKSVPARKTTSNFLNDVMMNDIPSDSETDAVTASVLANKCDRFYIAYKPIDQGDENDPLACWKYTEFYPLVTAERIKIPHYRKDGSRFFANPVYKYFR
ncbi:uncharacterized protein EV420DRAFT_1651156 [Desarmillaria tabescens]|uniref:Uncharacterized protein n=1 Tax=Armillaria tabescens TaxID=1929756 RepID=A0AA39JB61_ARMTA|nr:uncharacterized protein EV420DRAFT_1651156 [Desarmillaria tabescens]KAK0439094.1 hypothetical protein EV420DRAFT_1651156 [Desarmillaria tabescens]